MAADQIEQPAVVAAEPAGRETPVRLGEQRSVRRIEQLDPAGAPRRAGTAGSGEIAQGTATLGSITLTPMDPRWYALFTSTRMRGKAASHVPRPVRRPRRIHLDERLHGAVAGRAGTRTDACAALRQLCSRASASTTGASSSCASTRCDSPIWKKMASPPYDIATLEQAPAGGRGDGIGDGYVRPPLARPMMGVSAQNCLINVAIAAWTWPAYFTPEARPGDPHDPGDLRSSGAEYRTDPEQGCRSVHDLHALQARGRGQGLRRRPDARLPRLLAEGTGANLFLVIDGKLHTSTPDCFLDGITRQTVIGLARSRGIEVIERHIKPEELDTAAEVFLTGTAVEVTPVREIDAYRFEIGPITRQLINDFDALTREPARHG